MFYLVSLTLLVFFLLLFSRDYKELIRHSELAGNANAVHSNFQILSKQIRNAAVLNQDLIRSNNSSNPAELFRIGEKDIIKQLVSLNSVLTDSLIRKIAVELNTRIKAELSWILKSSVPDSIVLNKSPEHIASLLVIDSLIEKGISRTNLLIDHHSSRTNVMRNRLKIWMIIFVSLSAILLIYTTVNLFLQKSKREREVAELETVFSRISHGVVSVDNNWRYTFLNDAALATHPLGKKETLGKVIWDVHPEMKGTVFWDKYHEAMVTKKVMEITSYYEAMNIWFSVQIYPSSNGLTIFYKDVTESKKAEKELSKTLKEVIDYKFALDKSSIVVITDQKGIINYVNDNFCKISKYSREELIGQDHRIVNSGYHPKEYIKDLWVTIANGKIWDGDLKNKAKDGTIYWVDTTIVPFLDEHGKPYQYIAIRADITDRKLAEERLVKSEKIYKTIASSIPGSAICLLDRDYRYLLIEGDMAKKLGYSKEKLLGKKAEDVLSPEIFAGVENEFRRTFGGEIVTVESSRSGHDIISRSIPLKDETNMVYAIMTVAIDITDLKNAQRDIIELNRGLEEKIRTRTEEVRQTNEELEAFSYSVSHDLRAPLRGIIAFAKILEEEYGNKLDNEAKRITAIIRDSAIKMGKLIDDLLAFSRMGKQGITSVLVNTKLMAEEVVAEQEELNKHCAPIGWNIQDLPDTLADKSMIRQVWVNLISNAIKYSGNREKPHIEIGSYSDNVQTVFYVRDNGAGFDEQYKDKLFHVFQRLHDVDEFEGTGIGLAIVEKIISRHGGMVWAEGKENEGACFYFSLP